MRPFSSGNDAEPRIFSTRQNFLEDLRLAVLIEEEAEHCRASPAADSGKDWFSPNTLPLKQRFAHANTVKRFEKGETSGLISE